MYILEYSQGIFFPTLQQEIIKGIVRKREHQKLNLFIECTGVIRVGGRMKNSDADYLFKHPMLLSAKSAAVVSLVKYVHRSLGHFGSNRRLFEKEVLDHR